MERNLKNCQKEQNATSDIYTEDKEDSKSIETS